MSQNLNYFPTARDFRAFSVRLERSFPNASINGMTDGSITIVIPEIWTMPEMTYSLEEFTEILNRLEIYQRRVNRIREYYGLIVDYDYYGNINKHLDYLDIFQIHAHLQLGLPYIKITERTILIAESQWVLFTNRIKEI